MCAALIKKKKNHLKSVGLAIKWQVIKNNNTEQAGKLKIYVLLWKIFYKAVVCETWKINLVPTEFITLKGKFGKGQNSYCV